MKVRAARNIHNSQMTLEQFKELEFSTDMENFTPDLSLSCNECHDVADEDNHQDSVLSFLLKYKADKLSDPKVVTKGVAGMILPEIPDHTFEKSAGANSFFHSVKHNHYNLNVTIAQFDALTLDIFTKSDLRKFHELKDLENYIIENHERTEWKALFADSKKKNWKRFLRESLKKDFLKNFGDIKKRELLQAEQKDPSGVRKEIQKLDGFNCFTDREKNEIRQAFGPDLLYL
jgi:hypothetical protein